MVISLGRFLSADTIVPSPGNPQSLNRYSYVLNNALKYTDPTGHYAFEEDPDDPVSFGTNVRSQHDYTHPNYRAGNQSDAQFLSGAAAPIWVPAAAVIGGGTVEGGAALVKAAAQEPILEGYACAQSGLCRLAIQAVLARILGNTSTATSPQRVVYSGHGSWEGGWTTVPEGTSITFYSKHGGAIIRDLGEAIEEGTVPPGQYSETYGPGAPIPDYTLGPPEWTPLAGALSFEEDKLLSELLAPNMGEVHWAACTHCWNAPDSYRVWFLGGEGMIDYGGP